MAVAVTLQRGALLPVVQASAGRACTRLVLVRPALAPAVNVALPVLHSAVAVLLLDAVVRAVVPKAYDGVLKLQAA